MEGRDDTIADAQLLFCLDSGNVDIRKALPFLGSTQLQALTLLTTVVLIGTHGLTTYSVKERVLISDSYVD